MIYHARRDFRDPVLRRASVMRHRTSSDCRRRFARVLRLQLQFVAAESRASATNIARTIDAAKRKAYGSHAPCVIRLSHCHNGFDFVDSGQFRLYDSYRFVHELYVGILASHCRCYLYVSDRISWRLSYITEVRAIACLALTGASAQFCIAETSSRALTTRIRQRAMPRLAHIYRLPIGSLYNSCNGTA